MKLQRSSLIEELNDFGKERSLWTAETDVVKSIGVVCLFYYVEVVNVSESPTEVCVNLIGSYCQEKL